MWTARVPDWLLQYPCVATSDWAAYGDFPDGINPGVLLAKRRAPWLRYNMAAHRYYIEKNFVWNAVLMSYRTYERHPDQLLYYRHLQVMVIKMVMTGDDDDDDDDDTGDGSDAAVAA